MLCGHKTAVIYVRDRKKKHIGKIQKGDRKATMQCQTYWIRNAGEGRSIEITRNGCCVWPQTTGGICIYMYMLRSIYAYFEVCIFILRSMYIYAKQRKGTSQLYRKEITTTTDRQQCNAKHTGNEKPGRTDLESATAGGTGAKPTAEDKHGRRGEGGEVGAGWWRRWIAAATDPNCISWFLQYWYARWIKRAYLYTYKS